MIQEQEDFDFLCKSVLIGDSGVGKSNILTRFAKNEFNYDSKSTIGVEFATKIMDFKDARVKLQVWDTAGQDRYRAITKAYYRNAKVAYIIYDITKRSTFLNCEIWLKEFMEHINCDAIIYIIGNKCDLNHLRVVSLEELKEFADKHDVFYAEVSALNANGISDLFTVATEKSIGLVPKPEPDVIVFEPLSDSSNPKNKCC